jgi:hypothetical protein
VEQIVGVLKQAEVGVWLRKEQSSEHLKFTVSWAMSIQKLNRGSTSCTIGQLPSELDYSSDDKGCLCVSSPSTRSSV